MALSAVQVAALVGAGVITSPQGGGVGDFVSTQRLGMNYQDFNSMAANVSDFKATALGGGDILGVHIFGDDSNGWPGAVANWNAKIDAAIAANLPIALFNLPTNVFIPGTKIPAMSLAQIAAGEADIYLIPMIRKMKQAKTVNGKWRVRKDWEGNETYMPWSWLGQEADSIAAQRHVTDLLRAESSKFKTVWCPNPSETNNPMAAYPGDPYVDEFGIDVYLITQQLPNDDIARSFWYKFENVTYWSIKAAAAEAAARGKDLSICEWGVDHDLSRYFIEMIARTVREYNISFHMYWGKNAGTLFMDSLTDGTKPKAVAAMAKQFGPTFSFLNLSAVKGSTQHDTYYPLSLSKNGKLALSFVGMLPGGFSLVGRALKHAGGGVAGTYSVTVRATDESGYTTDQTITVTVSAAALPLFNPTFFAGLTHLWDPKVYSTLAPDSGSVSNNGKVRTIADRSSVGRGRTQTTFGNQPVYLASARNGLAGLQYTASAFSRMDVNSITGLPYGAAARTIFGAFYMTGAAKNLQKTILGMCDATGAVESELGHKGLNNATEITGYLLDAIGGTATPKTGQAKANADICFVGVKGAAASAGDLARLTQYVDGVRDGTLELLTSTVVPTKMVVGGRPTASASTNHCDWIEQELGGYDRELEDWQVKILEGYLGWNNAGISRYPDSHPFKLAPPRVFFQ